VTLINLILPASAGWLLMLPLHPADVAAVSAGFGWPAAPAALATWPAIHQVCYRRRTCQQWLGVAAAPADVAAVPAGVAAASAAAASSAAAARWLPMSATV